jgi:hypothetical protein
MSSDRPTPGSSARSATDPTAPAPLRRDRRWAPQFKRSRNGDLAAAVTALKADPGGQAPGKVDYADVKDRVPDSTM